MSSSASNDERKMELEREILELELFERRDEIVERLEELRGPRFVSKGDEPSTTLTDVHWDHVMKEMVRL